MKECPQCHRSYGDHLNHCLADGSPLRYRGAMVVGGAPPVEAGQGLGAPGAQKSDFVEDETPTSFLEEDGNDDKTPVVMIKELLNQEQSRGVASRELMSYLESAAAGKKKSPAVDSPVTEKSAADGPFAKKPAADGPFAKRSAADGPFAKKSAADESVVGKSAADRLTVEDPAVEELDLEELAEEEFSAFSSVAPPPPPVERGIETTTMARISSTGRRQVASGEIEVNSILPPKFSTQAATGAETSPNSSRGKSHPGKFAPVDGDEASLNENLFSLPVDHRRWILVGVGLIALMGISVLYFWTTSRKGSAPALRNANSVVQPAAAKTPLDFSPEDSSPLDSSVEDSSSDSREAARAPNATPRSADKDHVATPKSVEKGVTLPGSTPSLTKTGIRRPRTNNAALEPRSPREKRLKRSAKKNLYRKTIDPFSE